MEYLEQYQLTVLIIGLTGLAYLVQLLVADVAGIKAKHTPGYPVTPDHADFYFRAVRTLSNSNESAPIFILFVFFGLLSAASPFWLNTFSGVYLAGRVGHMLFYYAGINLPRSIAFGISLLGLAGMFVAGICSWL